MKQTTQITSWLLAVYFSALPILFGFHALQHQNAHNEGHVHGVEQVKSFSDCSVCTVYVQYQNQSATLNAVDFCEINFSSFTAPTHTDEIFVSINKDFRYLRGPPCS